MSPQVKAAALKRLLKHCRLDFVIDNRDSHHILVEEGGILKRYVPKANYALTFGKEKKHVEFVQVNISKKGYVTAFVQSVDVCGFLRQNYFTKETPSQKRNLSQISLYKKIKL